MHRACVKMTSRVGKHESSCNLARTTFYFVLTLLSVWTGLHRHVSALALKAMPHVTISSTMTMAFNVAKIASARASLTISLTKSLRVAVVQSEEGVSVYPLKSISNQCLYT